MGAQPWMKWYVGDWQRKPEVALLSAEARGVWLELLNVMHQSESASVTGTMKQIARMCRLDTGEVERGIGEIEAHEVAEVSRSNGSVTVTSRRRAREEKARESSRERVRRHRESRDTDKKRSCNASSNGQEMPTHARVRADSDSDSKKGSKSRTVKAEDARAKPPKRGAEDWAVAMYEEAFGITLHTLMWSKVKAKVKNREAWEYTLDRWRQNGYKPDNVGDLLNHYRSNERAMATDKDGTGDLMTYKEMEAHARSKRLTPTADYVAVPQGEGEPPKWRAKA